MDIRECIQNILLQLARQRKTMSYAQLVDACHVEPPAQIRKVTDVLEQMMEEDCHNARPMLAALVVSKRNPSIPGPGFFQQARQLGRYHGPDQGEEAIAYHAKELNRAWEYWG